MSATSQPVARSELDLDPLRAQVTGEVIAPGRDIALAAVDAPWLYFCLSMWMDPAEDQRSIEWSRGLAAAMAPYGVGTAFANFVAHDENGRLRASCGEHEYARLVELKPRFDPDNLFRLNQNISVE